MFAKFNQFYVGNVVLKVTYISSGMTHTFIWLLLLLVFISSNHRTNGGEQKFESSSCKRRNQENMQREWSGEVWKGGEWEFSSNKF